MQVQSDIRQCPAGGGSDPPAAAAQLRHRAQRERCRFTEVGAAHDPAPGCGQTAHGQTVGPGGLIESQFDGGEFAPAPRQVHQRAFQMHCRQVEADRQAQAVGEHRRRVVGTVGPPLQFPDPQGVDAQTPAPQRHG